MLIFSEMIVLHEDVVMPGEESFVPSFWAAADFDSDGDYYYDDIDGRWTRLRIARRLEDDRVSVVEVNTFRERQRYGTGIQEVADLERYLHYWHAGRYARSAPHIRTPAVTWMRIETHLLEDYREFLETVASFLAHGRGIVANLYEYDAVRFAAEVLGRAAPAS